jgi:hypothetical protein
MANARSLKAQIEADSKRFQELKADLERIEYFSKGTVLARMIKCGKPKCLCGAVPQNGTVPTSSGPTKSKERQLMSA